MALITINVPDSKLDFYTKVFSEFKDVFIEKQKSNYDSLFNEEFIKMLDERAKTPIENCKPATQMLEEIECLMFLLKKGRKLNFMLQCNTMNN